MKHYVAVQWGDTLRLSTRKVETCYEARLNCYGMAEVSMKCTDLGTRKGPAMKAYDKLAADLSKRIVQRTPYI